MNYYLNNERDPFALIMMSYALRKDAFFSCLVIYCVYMYDLLNIEMTHLEITSY